MNLNSFVVLNRGLEEIGKSINLLNVAEEQKPYIPQLKLESTLFEITEAVKRSTAAITAHDLSQYRNQSYTIRLQEDIKTWLDELLRIDEMEVKIGEIQGYDNAQSLRGV